MKELEERMLVSKAAKRHHLDARTLKRWLHKDMGYDFSEGGRLALVADIEAVIIRRTGKGERAGRRIRRLAGVVRRPRLPEQDPEPEQDPAEESLAG